MSVKAVFIVIIFFSFWIVAEKIICYLKKISENLRDIAEHLQDLNDIKDNQQNKNYEN
jgi:hypothetical protein